jgi:hypothetical protein
MKTHTHKNHNLKIEWINSKRFFDIENKSIWATSINHVNLYFKACSGEHWKKTYSKNFLIDLIDLKKLAFEEI